jgi:hypothetical protein
MKGLLGRLSSICVLLNERIVCLGSGTVGIAGTGAISSSLINIERQRGIKSKVGCTYTRKSLYDNKGS